MFNEFGKTDLIDDSAQTLRLSLVLIPFDYFVDKCRGFFIVQAGGNHSSHPRLEAGHDPPRARQPLAVPPRPRSLMDDSEQLLGRPETPILDLKGKVCL